MLDFGRLVCWHPNTINTSLTLRLLINDNDNEIILFECITLMKYNAYRCIKVHDLKRFDIQIEG
jgi:hypothetical protein